MAGSKDDKDIDLMRDMPAKEMEKLQKSMAKADSGMKIENAKMKGNKKGAM